MKVYACQLDIAWEDKRANHRRTWELLEAAAPEPGSLVVLPEMFATGFSMNVAGIAESAEGETHRFLAQTAQTLGVYLLAGVVRPAPEGRGGNEAVLFDPAGREAARYRKIHPFTYGGETDHYAPGLDLVTFSWEGMTVAPFICYDLRFPEVFRAAARAGAQLFTVIANWPAAREAHWSTLLRARAIENQAYVVGVNRCGRDPGLVYSGHSMVVDPRGEVLADAGTGEQVIVSDLDVDALHRYRRAFPALADARWPLSERSRS
ncbi:MAG: carbon-nitrogen family hydrolase [Armatimonadota bacterium]|nr:carbon-nitrogen family hydrolase [Armatimonadota bacterium]